MLTRLRAQNFKSWLDTGDLRLAPLTGLFGPNSVGKTSILQILLLLKQTVESPDRKRVLHTGDERSLVDLGTFFDLIHSHDASSPLELSLSWILPEPLSIDDPEREGRTLFRTQSLTFTTSVLGESKRPVLSSFSYEFDNHRFGVRRRTDAPATGKDKYDLETPGFQAKRAPGRQWPLPAPVKCYGFPDEALGYYQNTGFLPDFVLALEVLFSSMTYLGPLREYPKRSYVWAGERPVDVGRRGEQSIAALLAARAEDTRIPRGTGKARRYASIEERVLEWMRKMGVIHSFSLKPIAENRKDYEVRLRHSRRAPEVLITDVGFGVSQLLPVLVLCYYAPEGSTILLEQPEIHLHPSVQAWLADVFIDVTKERGVQIVVESHSEHLLRRLQRRIAEGVIPAERTALYFCKMVDESSSIEELALDASGHISNWPAGFFGDEMGDLVAMTEATMRRQGSHR